MKRLTRHIYSLLFYLALPYVILRLLWRSRNNPAYAERLRERFALFDPLPRQGGIWLHAVSLGEAIAAGPLIRGLLKQYPDSPIIVTSITPTGSEQIQALFGKEVIHMYAPYDLPDTVKRFINRVKPRLAIMMETELWPNLFEICRQRKIPILIANARLSLRSTQGYRHIPGMMQRLMRCITLVAAQSQSDADRFIELGMNPRQITITGSIKFDVPIPPSLFEKAALLRNLWGNDRSVWIAASTHEGEDEIIVDAFAKIRQVIPDVLLVLVPRHPERFSKVINLCKKRGYNVVTRSENRPTDPSTDIFVGDSTGELTLFYAGSDVAFVGGSLVPKGGHNLLEPASCGIPVLTGPHVFNFTEIYQLLQEAGAAQCIHTVDELASTLIELLQDADQREHICQRNREVMEKNRGALSAHLDLIQALEVK